MDNLYITKLNKIIHEPGRLSILIALNSIEYCDFTYLVNITGLTKGNLSLHLSKLEKTNFVKINKTYEGKTPKTYISLTKEGEINLREYIKELKSIIKSF